MELNNGLIDLYCPFPGIVCDESVLRHVRVQLADWMRRHPFCVDERQFSRYLHSGAVELVAATTPYPFGAELFAANVDFIAWLFVLDDVFCDEADPGGAAPYLEVLPYLMSVFDDSEPSPSDDAFVTGLADIVRRLRQFGSGRLVERFGALLREFLLCLAWEQQVRAAGRTPGYASYRRMRRRTGGLLPCVAIATISCGVDVDDEELARPEVLAMTYLCADHVVLANDLFSAAKESERETMSLRLPMVLMRERGFGEDVALRESVRICDDIVRSFIACEAKAQVDASPALLRYFAILRAWMRGNIDWSLLCNRYHHGSPDYAEAVG